MSVIVAQDWIGRLSDKELADWIIRMEAYRRDPGVRIDRAMNVITLTECLIAERDRRKGSC